MAQASIAAVAVPKGGFGHEVRAALVVWEREMIRFRRDPARVIASVIQPLLFLFVLGGGLGSLVQAGTGGVDFKTFLFPGVLSMSVLFTAAFAGISMVWDREFGFLREMLVAPVSTTAILVGKCLGGATRRHHPVGGGAGARGAGRRALRPADDARNLCCCCS